MGVQPQSGLKKLRWVGGLIERWKTFTTETTDRYGFEVLKSEDKWRKKYPNIAKKIDELERQVKDLTNKRDKNRPIKKD